MFAAPCPTAGPAVVSSFLSVSLWDGCVVARRCREREMFGLEVLVGTLDVSRRADRPLTHVFQPGAMSFSGRARGALERKGQRKRKGQGKGKRQRTLGRSKSSARAVVHIYTKSDSFCWCWVRIACLRNRCFRTQTLHGCHGTADQARGGAREVWLDRQSYGSPRRVVSGEEREREIDTVLQQERGGF